jgi:hypothetical protein
VSTAWETYDGAPTQQKLGRCQAGAQKGQVQPTLCHHVLQRLLQFQHWSPITNNMSTCGAAFTSFYSTGLVLPSLCQQVLQRLIKFRALVSYYQHYVNFCCSVYYNLENWSRIPYTMSTSAAAFTSLSALVSYYLEYVNMCCSD